MLIEKVAIRFFKKFNHEDFQLSDTVILAGANNSGKTTLLQALVVWNLALRKWIAERVPHFDSGEHKKIPSKRTGVAITRKDFTAIPLREMNLLWHNRSTALFKDELKEGQNLGTPRILEISVSGKNSNKNWELTFEYTYRYPDLIHTRPSKSTPIEDVLDIVKNMQVVHVPPFSGIGAEETRYDKAYQDLLIGQGKPGDILRNLLLEIYREKKNEWKSLVKDIKDIFGYNLLSIVYEGRPFINCEYQPGLDAKRMPKLDISSAGSGFLQVLMLLGFFYARPASILLLDEPDAHLHIILQKQVYDRLREIARLRGCQLLIATHSEVLIEATSPEQILSFFSPPHTLLRDTDKEKVREALKRLSSLDILLAESSHGVLYTEGESDLNLLREWSRVLKHPAHNFLESPFWHSNKGRDPREAKAHFFAIKAA